MWLTAHAAASSALLSLADVTVTTATPWCLPHSRLCLPLELEKQREDKSAL